MQWNDSIALCIFKKIWHWENQSVTDNSKISQNLEMFKSHWGQDLKAAPSIWLALLLPGPPAGLDPRMTAVLLGADFRVALSQAIKRPGWLHSQATGSVSCSNLENSYPWRQHHLHSSPPILNPSSGTVFPVTHALVLSQQLPLTDALRNSSRKYTSVFTVRTLAT